MRPGSLIPGIRAYLAKRLSERGYSNREIAEILGVSPAAITLYIQGRRADKALRILERSEAREIVEKFLEKSLENGEVFSEAKLYDLAFEVINRMEPGRESYRSELSRRADVEVVLNSLRKRLQAEQEAAMEFMRVAGRLESHVAQMLFRIIASDSIRHADIIDMIGRMIEWGEEPVIDLPEKEVLKRLIETEETAHVHSLDNIKDKLPHEIVKILLDAIEDDERKHEKILRSLLKYLEEHG